MNNQKSIASVASTTFPLTTLIYLVVANSINSEQKYPCHGGQARNWLRLSWVQRNEEGKKRGQLITTKNSGKLLHIFPMAF